MKKLAFVFLSLICAGTFASAENQIDDLLVVLSSAKIKKLGNVPESRITFIEPLKNGNREFKIGYNNGAECFVIGKIYKLCDEYGCSVDLANISQAVCK